MESIIDINYIVHTIQEVLNKVHVDKNKRSISVKSDRISFACPICGDSSKNTHQKRGHLFLNNLYYKCYNEDCRSTFTKLAKDYNVHIDADTKIKLINYIDTQFHTYKKQDDDWIVGNMTKLIDLNDLSDWINSIKGPLRNFKQVSFGSKVYTYLLDRGIPENIITSMFYEGIKSNNKFSEPYVVFINKIGDKVIGMQERNIRSGTNRKFKIWTFKELYEAVTDNELDIIESISYNKLSYLFNILNVDFEQEITIFEGYIDSLFMPNSIGAVGINTDYSFLINNDVNLKFFFDNDDIGKRKSLEWLKKGFRVFLWEKLVYDMAKEQKDPYLFINWFNSNIKDLNAFMKIYLISYKKLYKYFSNDVSDTYWINFKKYIKKSKQIKEKSIDIDILEKLKLEMTNYARR